MIHIFMQHSPAQPQRNLPCPGHSSRPVFWFLPRATKINHRRVNPRWSDGSPGSFREPERGQGDGAELKKPGEVARKRSPLLSDGKLLISHGRGSGDQSLTGLGNTEAAPAAAEALAKDSSLSCQGVSSQCRESLSLISPSLCYIGPS